MDTHIEPNRYYTERHFTNGWGVSVICRSRETGAAIGSYGADSGLFEVAVLHGDKLCARSRLMDGNAIKGWLTFGQVSDLIASVKALNEIDRCSHRAERG